MAGERGAAGERREERGLRGETGEQLLCLASHRVESGDMDTDRLIVILRLSFPGEHSRDLSDGSGDGEAMVSIRRVRCGDSERGSVLVGMDGTERVSESRGGGEGVARRITLYDLCSSELSMQVNGGADIGRTVCGDECLLFSFDSGEEVAVTVPTEYEDGASGEGGHDSNRGGSCLMYVAVGDLKEGVREEEGRRLRGRDRVHHRR